MPSLFIDKPGSPNRTASALSDPSSRRGCCCVSLAVDRLTVEARARQTRGESADAIYRAIALALARRGIWGNMLLDVGCGAGRLWPFVCDRFATYIGVDGRRERRDGNRDRVHGGRSYPADGTALSRAPRALAPASAL